MLLPEVLKTITFYSFFIVREDQHLKIDAVKAKDTWYSFQNAPLVNTFPCVAEATVNKLIVNNFFINVDKSLFEKGLHEVLSNDETKETCIFFENQLVEQSSLNPDDLFDLKSSTIGDTVNMINFFQNNSKLNLSSFDIVTDEPKKWIENVQFSIQFFGGDVEIYGKLALAFLLKSADWDWLNGQMQQDAQLPWKTLADRFVTHYTKKQTEYWNAFELPLNNYDDLEEQIELKMRIWTKKIAKISQNQLRTLILKGLVLRVANIYSPLYQKCSDQDFVRASRILYDYETNSFELDSVAGLEVVLAIKENKSDLQTFDESNDNPSEWIQKFETSIQSLPDASKYDLNENGKNILAFYLSKKSMQWLHDVLIMHSNSDWEKLKKQFIEDFTKNQEEQEMNLFSNYRDGNIEKFVQNKIDEWTKLIPTISSKELNEIIAQKLPEANQKLIEGCLNLTSKEFLICCKISFHFNLQFSSSAAS